MYEHSVPEYGIKLKFCFIDGGQIGCVPQLTLMPLLPYFFQPQQLFSVVRRNSIFVLLWASFLIQHNSRNPATIQLKTTTLFFPHVQSGQQRCAGACSYFLDNLHNSVDGNQTPP